MRVKRATAVNELGWTLGLWTAAAVSLWACSDDAPDLGDPVEALDRGELRGTFDERGGRMEGAVGGPLEGVSIELPRGAISRATTFVVRTAWDAAPLPERAFAVGPHIELTTEDGSEVTFAKPVTVTLPTYPERVRSFNTDVAGVKVWRQSPDGWELVDALAGTATRVAVEFDRTTLAGAGVKLDEQTVDGAACVGLGGCVLRSPDPTCADATAPCLTPLAYQGDPLRLEAMVQAGPASIALVQRRASAEGVVLEAIRLDLDTGEQVTSMPLEFAVAGDADRVYGAAFDAQGDLWVGLRRGVARLSLSSAPSMYVPGYEGALAHHVTAHPSGQPLWITRDHDGLALSTLRSGDTWSEHGRLDAALSAPVGALDAGITAAVLDTSNGAQLWVATLTTPDPIFAFDLTPGDPISPPSRQVGPVGPLLQLSATGTTSPQALWIQSADLSVWRQGVLDASAQQRGALGGSIAIAPDLLGGTWGALADAPALIHNGDQGFPTLIPLGDSSEEAAAAQRGARALLALDANTLVILTRAGELFALHTP